MFELLMQNKNLKSYDGWTINSSSSMYAVYCLGNFCLHTMSICNEAD